MQSLRAPQSLVQSPPESLSISAARPRSISGKEWVINSLAIIVLLASGIV